MDRRGVTADMLAYLFAKMLADKFSDFIM